MARLRLLVVACPVLQREIELLALEASTAVTTRWLDMGLHEGSTEGLRSALQAAIDRTRPGEFDAIAIAYGLCNRGIVGLTARSAPVVLPKAHDCIGLLLGSTQGYLARLELEPGTYFQSAGWLEHVPANGEVRPQMSFGRGATLTRERLADRYGEENADYLLEQWANLTKHYARLAFIATPAPEAKEWEAIARERAQKCGWEFERLAGELGWLRRLVNAEWNDGEFLKLSPGERVVLRFDPHLIGTERA
jgi:hypothetical protein